MEFKLKQQRKEVYLMLRDNFNHSDEKKVEEIVNKIKNQDKEFIKILKEEIRIKQKATVAGNLGIWQLDNIIDELVGEVY